MRRPRAVLLALGDVPTSLSKLERSRALQVAEALGAKLAQLEVRLLFGGRRNTLADIAIQTLRSRTSAKYVREHVSTYLPSDIRQSEIPRRDFITFGAVITTEGLPEQRREALVHDCDTAIVMGIGRGIVEMSRIACRRSRFIIPLPCAEGPAMQLYAELARGRVDGRQATIAVRTLGDKHARPLDIATAACSLLRGFIDRRIGRSRVFLAMPFVRAFRERKAAEYALIRVCNRLGLTFDVARDTAADRPLITEILARIDRAAAVVACLDEARPNVYFEAGHAFGLRKPTVLCLKTGSEPAFDVQAFEQIRWRDPADLEKKLYSRIKLLMNERIVIA